MADGDAVEIAAEDLADLLGRIAVGDLGGLALDESGMPAELGDAGFERAARACDEKKKSIASTLSRR